MFSLVNPHAFLGIHPVASGQKVIRLFRPGASHVHFELQGKRVEAQASHEPGLFTYLVPESLTRNDYRIYLCNGTLAHDPYTFLPTFGELDAHLFNQGVHYKLYEAMGGRYCHHEGVEGVRFVVWAPSAQGVAVVGDFNQWDGRVHPLRSLGVSGVWELFVPGLQPGAMYKFEIHTQEGAVLLKADPYALYAEHRPKTASIIWDVDSHVWQDSGWMQQRELLQGEDKPLLIYEVHLDSWKKEAGSSVNYRQIAPELAAYCVKMGFSHVELLPITEHPLDESWGYQVTGFFSVTSRMGTPSDFQAFVDCLHQAGIGVILDWVPAHFPIDSHALAQFDGSCLYEHADPSQGLHPHWNTCIFNYARHEVSNFLLASALFFADKMHIDGLRVDAVASMLYLDYGRSAGQWMPNRYGGNHNLEAIAFLKHFNRVMQERFSAVRTIAEESTSFLGVTHPLSQGGLGFHWKWNMGWMNDTLRYFCRDPLFRPFHQNELTFVAMYAFSEKFVLPLSHDEVVHGKGALLSKMPGDDWQKFANLRLLYSYQICQSGKKLLFMGAELGQWDEWQCKRQLPWHLLAFERHAQLHHFFEKMNHFYRTHPALFSQDTSSEGFAWVDCADRQNAVISYLRRAQGQELLVVHNFTPMTHFQYQLTLSGQCQLQEVFNTDRVEYFGSGKLNPSVPVHRVAADKTQAVLQLAPLATLIFQVTYD